MQVGRPSRNFEFEVLTISSITLLEENAARARSYLHEVLVGVGARVTSGAATGLEMSRLRMVGNATLLSIDGQDPTAEIEAALLAYRGSGRASREDAEDHGPEASSRHADPGEPDASDEGGRDR